MYTVYCDKENIHAFYTVDNFTSCLAMGYIIVYFSQTYTWCTCMWRHSAVQPRHSGVLPNVLHKGRFILVDTFCCAVFGLHIVEVNNLLHSDVFVGVHVYVPVLAYRVLCTNTCFHQGTWYV